MVKGAELKTPKIRHSELKGAESRRAEIVTEVQTSKEVRVDALAKKFSTSEVTIRKDLSELEHQGLLVRRFGGAISVPQEPGQPVCQSPLQIAIAKAASKLICNNSRLIIDSGRTTNALLPFLSQKTDLVIMTNSLNTAITLSTMESQPTLLMSGGTWDKQSESFQGRLAKKFLQEYDFDQLFIGADGIDLTKGTTTFNEFTDLSQAMAACAQEVILMAESQKIGRKMHNVELFWQDITYFVTDNQIPVAAQLKIEAHGVTVICIDS